MDHRILKSGDSCRNFETDDTLITTREDAPKKLRTTGVLGSVPLQLSTESGSVVARVAPCFFAFRPHCFLHQYYV